MYDSNPWGFHPLAFEHPFNVPELGGELWFPVVETIDPYSGTVMNRTTYDRWEACDAARRILRSGRAVVIVDACPTCQPRVKFAAGPSCPLTSGWRPLRGSAPRYR